MTKLMNHLLHANVSSQKLIEKYNEAREAIFECNSIEDCNGWIRIANGMESLASQFNDQQTELTANSIKEMAINRADELRKEHRDRNTEPHARKTIIGLVGLEECMERVWPNEKSRPCKRTFERMKAEGIIPFVKFGKCCWYSPEKVLNAIIENCAA